jgi:hypothetical protein
VGGADTISIKFSEDVNISADCLKLTGLYTATRPTLASFSYDILTQTATWQFATITSGDQYLISLSDTVTDVEGNRLDGEWTNPASISTTNTLVSHFPSGNGTAGGSFNFVATLLPGDVGRNNWVYYGNYFAVLMPHYGLSGVWQFTDGDLNGDGTVNSADVSLFFSNLSVPGLQTVAVLADLNHDFKVDDADLTIFNANIGISNPTPAQGDFNHDGHIDIHDLDLMFAQYGLKMTVVS